ncbi:monocarboxylate transporter 4-like, partial [Argiope bruennichi]|uniref:monocarboxylate transporter 4-like n=1 Tax=Argiope bruennichi TaxID=94029 RepID=UPI0024956840
MAIKTNNWLVAVACSMIIGLNFSFLRIAGLLYIATMERFNVSKNQASLPYFWCNLMKSFVGPLVGYFAKTYGSREITTAGAAVSALGIGMCFFVEHITILIILWGGMFGIGVSMSSSMIGDILNDHFDESHIATASGISYGGAGIGSFIFVYLCDFLLNQYHLSGTFLILSGLILNGLPLGMILMYSKVSDGVVNTKQYSGTLNDYDLNIDATKPCLISLTKNNKSAHSTPGRSNGSNCGIELEGVPTDESLRKMVLKQPSHNVPLDIKNVEKHLSNYHSEIKEE